MVIEGKFLAHLFTGAKQGVFLVATIGPGVEERVSQLFGKGDSVEAVVLDAVGSAAIMSVFSSVLNRIYEETEARDWVTGTCLRPGQSYWDITGQESIFQVVNGNQIGVELLDSSFMRPQKSQSAVVPIGPDMMVHGDPNESYCRYCQATRCPMRQEPQVSHKP
jgi:cobalamin-dependent methionine synthase I